MKRLIGLGGVVAMAGLLGGCAIAGAAPTTSALPRQPAGISNAAAKPIKYPAGSIRLVLVPSKAQPDDKIALLANADGISQLECSEAAVKAACADTLQGLARVWAGSKDGWNTGETTWQLWPGKDSDNPANGVFVRHPYFGDRDLVLSLATLIQRTIGATPRPSTSPTAIPTSRPAAIPTIYNNYSESEYIDWAIDERFYCLDNSRPDICQVDVLTNGAENGRGIGRTATCTFSNHGPFTYDSRREVPGWHENPPADMTVLGIEGFSGNTLFSACYDSGGRLVVF